MPAFDLSCSAFKLSCSVVFYGSEEVRIKMKELFCRNKAHTPTVLVNELVNDTKLDTTLTNVPSHVLRV